MTLPLGTKNEQKSLYLDADIPLTKEEYSQVEKELLALLDFEEAAFEDRLIAGSVWLDILRDFVKAMAPQACNDAVARKEIFDTFFASMKNECYERPLRIAKKPIHSPALQRMFLGVLIAFRNRPERRRSTPITLAFILYHYVKNFLKLGRIRILPLKTRLSFRDLRDVRLDTMSDFFVAEVKKWVRKFISEKNLLCAGNIREGYHYLLTYYALMRWYAVGLAKERDSREISSEDIRQAIELVEQYYVFHPCFADLFTYYPVLSDIIDKTFAKKASAMSLVRLPIKSCKRK